MADLEWNKAFALEQAGDDEELLRELLEIFKISFQSDCQLIADGLAAANSQQVRAAAHSIKGAAASLGMTAITNLAKQLENSAKSSDLENAPAALDAMRQLGISLRQLP